YLVYNSDEGCEAWWGSKWPAGHFHQDNRLGASFWRRRNRVRKDIPMRNHIKAICVCVFLGGTLLSAQSRVVATVPFDFVVRNHLLPAGVYSISVDAERNAVLIRGEEANAIFALTHAAQSDTIGTDAKLVFKRYGDR